MPRCLEIASFQASIAFSSGSTPRMLSSATVVSDMLCEGRTSNCHVHPSLDVQVPGVVIVRPQTLLKDKSLQVLHATGRSRGLAHERNSVLQVVLLKECSRSTAQGGGDDLEGVKVRPFHVSGHSEELEHIGGHQINPEHPEVPTDPDQRTHLSVCRRIVLLMPDTRWVDDAEFLKGSM